MCACNVIFFSLNMYQFVYVPFDLCLCMCCSHTLGKYTPVQWHNFMLSKVEKMQSGLPLFLCEGLWLLSRDGSVAPAVLSLACAAFHQECFHWASVPLTFYLLEFWAFLFFVALQDDLGSSWIFSSLAPKWVISTRVPWLENGIRNQICSGVLITVSLLSGNRLCRVIKYIHTY